MFTRRLQWIWLVLITFLLDQASKYWALAHLSFLRSQPVMPHFRLTLTYNTGAAFSLLHNAGGWQTWGLSGLAIVISITIIIWLMRLPPEQKLTRYALSLILGGALGNLCDRLSLGYVVDFIELYYKLWSFPIFNIADTAICIGGLLMVIETISASRRPQVNKK